MEGHPLTDFFNVVKWLKNTNLPFPQSQFIDKDPYYRWVCDGDEFNEIATRYLLDNEDDEDYTGYIPVLFFRADEESMGLFYKEPSSILLYNYQCGNTHLRIGQLDSIVKNIKNKKNEDDYECLLHRMLDNLSDQ